MKSFCIQIIALDQKQEGFYILFIQKYETNYYLESSSCLVGKFKRILLPAGINTLLLFTYLFCLLIRNKVLIRMEVLIWKEIKLKEYQGPEKISCKCYGCFVGSTPAYVNQGFSFVHSMWCLAVSKTLALEWREEKWKNPQRSDLDLNLDANRAYKQEHSCLEQVLSPESGFTGLLRSFDMLANTWEQKPVW